MKRNIIIGLTALVALLIAWVLVHSANGRTALQRYEAELRAKGEKLTIEELAIPPSTNADEVASRQTLASGGLFTGGGLLPEVMKLTSNGNARVAWRAERMLYQAVPTRGGWTNTVISWAELDATNAYAAASLETVRAALVHPTPDTGWVWLDNYQHLTNGPPRTFLRDRNLAQSFLRAAIGELHKTNLTAALSDLHALINLSQVNRNELTLVHPMIRVAIARIGLAVTWEALQAPGWTDPQLAEIQHAWEQLDLLAGVERGFEGERAFGQVMLEQIRKSPNKALAEMLMIRSRSSQSGSLADFFQNAINEQIFPVVYKMTSINEDGLLRLRAMNDNVAVVRLAQAGKPWAEISVLQSNLATEFDRKLSQPFSTRFVLTRVSVPNFSRALQNTIQAETLRRLALTALALQRYELAHHAPPPNLAALVPNFLPAIPLDPMNAKPLSYHLNPDGTYRLYSVGEDGIDNGGKSGPDMWKAPDAVWPLPEN